MAGAFRWTVDDEETKGFSGRTDRGAKKFETGREIVKFDCSDSEGLFEY